MSKMPDSPGVSETLRLYALLGWRNLWRRPRRSILTIFAIILGLLLFIITRAIQFGTYEKIIEKAVRASTGYIQIHREGYLENRSFEYLTETPEIIYEALDREANVSLFAPRITSEALIASDEGTTGTAVVGVDPERETEVTTLSEKIREGNTLVKAGDIIIGDKMARNLKVSPGDELILIGNGADGSLGADRFTLAGIFTTGIADFDRGVVMIGLDDADRLYSMGGSITEIAIILKDFSLVDVTAESLKKSLAGQGVEVHTWEELLPEMVQMIRLDDIGGLVMLWFFFVIAVAVILNTILISTLERIKEFGIMLSLGLRPSKIFLMVLFEAGMLVSVGTVIALSLSWWLGKYLECHPFGMGETMSRIQEEMGFSSLIYTKMTPDLLFSWGGAMFAASMIVAMYPALKVARLKPLNALHPGKGEL